MSILGFWYLSGAEMPGVNPLWPLDPERRAVHMGLSWVQNTALFPMCLRQMLRRVVNREGNLETGVGGRTLEELCRMFGQFFKLTFIVV